MDKEYISNKLKSYVPHRHIKKDTVSVIVPFYRSFDPNKVKLAIDSILGQKDVALELVVSEVNQEPLLEGKLPKNVKYIFNPLKEKAKTKFFRPGHVRNTAVVNSSGEFLYNNDGDVIFQSQTYLKEILELMSQGANLVLYHPPMRRLPVNCFDEFKINVNEKGIWQAIASLDRSQPYEVTTEKNKEIMKVFKKFEYNKERIFLYTASDHKKYLSDPRNKGQEPIFSTLHFHAGGILMKRSQFDLIGGYSQIFAGWGCHDEDIQWKLSEVFCLRSIPPDSIFEVIHLDHPKDYFSKERWQENRKLQKSRIKRGIISCAIEDILELNKYHKVEL